MEIIFSKPPDRERIAEIILEILKRELQGK